VCVCVCARTCVCIYVCMYICMWLVEYCNIIYFAIYMYIEGFSFINWNFRQWVCYEIAKVDLSDIHLNYYNSCLLGALCLMCAISDHKFPRMRLLHENTHSSFFLIGAIPLCYII